MLVVISGGGIPFVCGSTLSECTNVLVFNTNHGKGC